MKMSADSDLCRDENIYVISPPLTSGTNEQITFLDT